MQPLRNQVSLITTLASGSPRSQEDLELHLPSAGIVHLLSWFCFPVSETILLLYSLASASWGCEPIHALCIVTEWVGKERDRLCIVSVHKVLNRGNAGDVCYKMRWALFSYIISSYTTAFEEFINTQIVSPLTAILVSGASKD